MNFASLVKRHIAQNSFKTSFFVSLNFCNTVIYSKIKIKYLVFQSDLELKFRPVDMIKPKLKPKLEPKPKLKP
jgi:hypothetical protein